MPKAHQGSLNCVKMGDKFIVSVAHNGYTSQTISNRVTVSADFTSKFS